MKKAILLCCLLVSCTVAFSQIMFLNLGKSIPADAREGLLVSSYSIGTSGGNPSITVTMDANSSALPALLQATATGTMFQKADLTTYELGKVSSKFSFTDVMIVSISVSGDGIASVTLIYGGMKSK